MFWLTTKVLFVAYTATLTSFLTLTSQEPRFQTLQDAVLHPSYDVGTLGGTALKDLIEVSGVDL